MVDIPTIDLALTGANIMKLRKAAGLSVHDLQSSFGFNSPQAIYKWLRTPLCKISSTGEIEQRFRLN